MNGNVHDNSEAVDANSLASRTDSQELSYGAGGLARGRVAAVVSDPVSLRVQGARCAQRQWAAVPIRRRLRLLRRVRDHIAWEAKELAELAPHAGRTDSDTLVSEVLPMLDAVRYLEKRAVTLLQGRFRRRAGPLWLMGQSLWVERVPHGVVLILGPGNYKLMLAGIQSLQALAAGNAVVVKPGRDAFEVIRAFKRILDEAGLPRGLFQLLTEPPQQAHRAIRAGVDHVVFTGSNSGGRSVHKTAAEQGISTTMELSGCDASFVLRDADVRVASEALSYGLRFNGGDTCVSPRRLFVDHYVADALISALIERVQAQPPVSLDEAQAKQGRLLLNSIEQQGGRVLTHRPAGHVWRPVLIDCGTESPAMLDQPTSLPILTIRRFTAEAAAVREANANAYGLAASMFTGAHRRAQYIAEQIKVGTVMINDLIVPVADPRLPFEGRGESGFGVTRGPEGLLAMTRARAISQSRPRRRPYWQALPQSKVDPIADTLQLLHRRRRTARLRALGRLINGLFRRKSHAYEQ